MKVQSAEEAEKIEAARRELEAKTRLTTNATDSEESDNEMPKVGRNEPCPCGSGKKYKQCHGRLV